MNVEAYLLSHPHDYPSTAFLIECEGDYLLYFGDTSSDKVEKERHIESIWRRIAPILKAGKLSGMLLECSFPNNGVDGTLLGHLNPKLMMREFHHLAQIAGVSLKGLNVVVTHRKERLETGPDAKALIIKELAEANDLGLHLIFPHQGDKIIF